MNILCELDPEELENEYMRQLEEDWRETLPKFTDVFLLEEFGEALDQMDDKLSELKGLRKKCLIQIRDFGKRYVVDDSIGSCFARMCIQHFLVNELLEIEKSQSQIKRLRSQRSLPERPKNNNDLTLLDIEKARNVDLVSIAQSHITNLKKSGKNFLGRCPFHEDTSPSFYIYSKSNRFHCFGCNANGDSISFVQKIYGQGFKSAVYNLIQR